MALRPIEPVDKDELQAGLQRLSPQTVQRRFLAPKTHFSKAELRYLTEVDGHDHVAIVVERATDPGTIVAVSREGISVAPGPAASADVAIVIADFLQHRGLGSLLAEALADAAIAHGIRRFSALMLGENRPAQLLMGKLANRHETHYDSTGSVDPVRGLLSHRSTP